MPVGRKTTAAKVAAAPEFAAYLDKEPTAVQMRFADWLLEKTGYEPRDPEEYALIARVAVILYGRFQTSSENKEFHAELRQVREESAAERAERSAARAAAALAKREAKDERAAERQTAKEAKAAATPAKATKAAPAAKATKAAPAKASTKAAPAKKVAAAKASAKSVSDILPPAPHPKPRKRAAGSTAPF